MNNSIYLNLGTTMCDNLNKEQRELKQYAKLEGVSWYSLRRRKRSKK